MYVTRADSPSAALWGKEDTPEYQKGREGASPVPAPPPVAAHVTATTWEKLVEFATDRPLIELRLVASTPAAAQTLVALAQPLGAETLSLTVTVGGPVKDGGTINFAANDLKPTHPTKPLAVAQTLHTALIEGAGYEADLALGFGVQGRSGLQAQLQALADRAGDSVTPRATFEKPVGGTR